MSRANSAPTRKRASEAREETQHSPPISERSQHSDYISVTASAMLDAKDHRKRAESDLQLLANRLALLRLEEQKAMDKISETKQRAKEIVGIKKRNEDHMHAKISLHLQKEMAIKESQERSHREREERRLKLKQSKKFIEDNKRAMAEEKRLTSMRFEKIVIENRAQTEMEKRMRAEEEKRKQEIFRRLREKERAEKEYQAQVEYARRIEEEAKKRKDTEALIEKLEKEERDMIERLKRTQKLQQQAYDVLQSSLDT